jgi:hypothetical protein
MRKSKKLILVALFFLGFTGLHIVPVAHCYWYFYDLVLIQLKSDSYPDICVLSDDLVFKGNAFGPTTDTYFYLTTLNNNAGFQNPSDIVLGRDSPKYVTEAYMSSGDLNNDGHVDVVATSINAAAVFILFQKADSSGAFDTPLIIPVGATPQKTAIGDLNADGFNDIAVSGTNGNLTILLNSLSNQEQMFIPISLNHSSVYVDIGDLNADHQNDIVLAGTDNILVLFQDPLNPGDFVDTLNLTTGPRPSCVKIADMDNDGFMDIVAGFRGAEGTHDTGSVSVFYQDPTKPGTFLSSITYNLPCEAVDIDVGDLNADGLLDIAVASRCGGDGAIKLFFQNIAENRSFTLAKSLSCEEVPFTVKIADMDYDGRNDIVVSDWDLIVFYQNESIPGDFPEPNVVLQSELSHGGTGGGGSGGAGGSGCFISTISH